MNRKSLKAGFVWLLLALLGTGFQAGRALADASEAKAAKTGAGAATAPANDGKAVEPVKEAEGGSANRLVRDGLVVEFSAKPALEEGQAGARLVEGGFANVTFRITDAENGKPVRGLYPAAWMDIGKPWYAKSNSQPMDCKARVGLYLQGTVGMRPLIDLNSYFVLVMNQDATITVIDPLVGITGITKLYAQINLKRPGADWAKTRDEKRMFVTMPRANQIAVVDLNTFKVTGNMDAGHNPVRVAIQPDEKYLWIGNDAEQDDRSGVTVIDLETLAVAGFIPTGKGHHELAFSTDSRYAFVTNRGGATVSVIDIQQLKKVKELRTGPLPISLAFSSLSRMLYVGDGKSGKITVVDGKSHDTVATIEAKPGLGPLRFSPDGRWGIVVNTSEDVAHVIDSSTNRIAHTLTVGAKPYQVSFTRAFAYIRSLGTERVSMVELQHFDKPDKPPVVSFPVGAVAPGKVKDVSLGDGIKEAAGEAAVLVVSPGDLTVYYYMEGMNAPMGNFRNYGRLPRAVEVADRTLREEEPGVYSARVQIPAAGTYDVAFLLDTPRILHCFSVVARLDPNRKRDKVLFAVEYLLEQRIVKAGDTMRVRFRLTDRGSKEPRVALDDVRVLYYLAPGRRRTEVAAQEVADGTYEAVLSLPQSGAYFVHVGSASANIRFGELPYLTLRAVRETARARATGEADTMGEEKEQ